MSSINESRSDQMGEFFDQLSKSNKSTIAGFMFKAEGNYATLKPETFSYVVWMSFAKDILKTIHGMGDMEIESTFSHFLETWLVLSDDQFQIPLRFREDIFEKALSFFGDQGFEPEECKKMCKEWRKRQVEMDKAKSSSSSSSKQ
jgi:hypothetical protein